MSITAIICWLFERKRKVSELLAKAGETQTVCRDKSIYSSTDKDFCRHQVEALVERLHNLPIA